MLALRQVAMAQGGIAAVARRARLTREAAYRILSKVGNPELRSLSAILAAAGLRLSVRPIDKPPSVAQKPPRYRVSRRAHLGLLGEAVSGLEDVRNGHVASARQAFAKYKVKRKR